MAMTTVPQFMYPGHPLQVQARNLALQTLLIDAATEKAALVCQVPKTGSVTHVHFRSGTTVTTPGNADVRLETVSLTDGNPTGVLVGTTTNAVQAVSAASTWYRTALTAAAAVTRGNLIAIVIENQTGNYQIATFDNGAGCLANFPYGAHFASAAWNKSGLGTLTAILEYSDTTYPFIPGVFPVLTTTLSTINTGTTPDEIGVRFTAPPIAMRVNGAFWFIDADAAFDLILYDAASTPLATVSLDPDVRAQVFPGFYEVLFPSDVTLSPGLVYRLVAKPTSGSSISVPYATVNVAAYLSAFPGGTDWAYTSRTDAGAWSQTADRWLPAGLLVDGLESGRRNIIGG